TAQHVLSLARQVAADPNNAELHAQLSQAYFARGAAGDAMRSLKHARRAGGLNPHAPMPTATPAPGNRSTPLTAEMDEADMAADATLPDDGESAQQLDRKLRA